MSAANRPSPRPQAGLNRQSMAAVRAAADSTVVVVDDQPTNIALLERLLEASGVGRMRSFTDPRKALAHCADALPDLVLLDLHMPELDGFGFMDALQAMVPDGQFLPILVLTADATRDVKERALAAGAKDFLTKPFDRTEVLLRVANLLETRSLYRQLERDNARLKVTLAAHTAAEREAVAELARRRDRIDRALAPGALTMSFQPIADLATGDVVGVEALARFGCEPRRPPNEWFAEADEIDRGAELELVAIAVALGHFDQLPDGVFMAVNTSPATATSAQLEAVLAPYPAERVVLELTEHTRIDDYDALLTVLGRFRRRGMRIAVDDTGTGYASFQHLLRLRPDIIKLDTTLTRGIGADPVRRSLAAALVSFATEIDATVIAEGIEVGIELTTLERIAIPWGQGYHLARPGPLPLPALRLASLATRSPEGSSP
jgi:EAL domain-containing protein (putative c-di-GMP-specific phosphodiesterase class I)/AmiR/NasT family two-component response regulator